MLILINTPQSRLMSWCPTGGPHELEEWRRHATDLSSIPIPYDGDPPRQLPEETCADDEFVVVKFPITPPQAPPMPIQDVKVVALDLFGAVFVRLFLFRDNDHLILNCFRSRTA